MITRVAIYARVDADDERWQQRRLEQQLRAARSHAREYGYAIVQEFVDQPGTGDALLADRPAGKAMIQAFERTEFGTVLVPDARALGRDTRSLHYEVAGTTLAIRELLARGIRIITLAPFHDYADALGHLDLFDRAIELYLAERRARGKAFAERMRRAREAARKRRGEERDAELSADSGNGFNGC